MYFFSEGSARRLGCAPKSDQIERSPSLEKTWNDRRKFVRWKKNFRIFSSLTLRVGEDLVDTRANCPIVYLLVPQSRVILVSSDRSKLSIEVHLLFFERERCGETFLTEFFLYSRYNQLRRRELSQSTHREDETNTGLFTDLTSKRLPTFGKGSKLDA